MVNLIVNVIASLIATLIGMGGMWLYHYKRRSDLIANQIEGFRNDVGAIKTEMENRFDGVNNRFDQVNNRFDQVTNEQNILLFEFSKLTDKQRGLSDKVSKIELASSIANKIREEIEEHEDKQIRTPDAATENDSTIEDLRSTILKSGL